AGKRDDAAPFQPRVEMFGRAVVGGCGDIGAEDRAHGASPGGRIEVLYVLAVGADIADVREGEGDDLPGIGGIGEDFLIAGERGVKTQLPDGMAGCTEAVRLEHRAVSQNQQRCRPAHAPWLSLSHAKTPYLGC